MRRPAALFALFAVPAVAVALDFSEWRYVFRLENDARQTRVIAYERFGLAGNDLIADWYGPKLAQAATGSQIVPGWTLVATQQCGDFDYHWKTRPAVLADCSQEQRFAKTDLAPGEVGTLGFWAATTPLRLLEWALKAILLSPLGLFALYPTVTFVASGRSLVWRQAVSVGVFATLILPFFFVPFSGLSAGFALFPLFMFAALAVTVSWVAFAVARFVSPAPAPVASAAPRFPRLRRAYRIFLWAVVTALFLACSLPLVAMLALY